MSFDVVSLFPEHSNRMVSPVYERMVDNEKNRRSQDFLLCQHNKAMHGRELLQVLQPNFRTD
jgi:hypothetical protein